MHAADRHTDRQRDRHVCVCLYACIYAKFENALAGAFDTTDKEMMLRTVIATLQDLGFIIDQADEDIGSVTGTKISGYTIRMTVITRSRGETQTSVRANAYYNVKPIEDPGPYQDFFTSLSKALFLTAHEVD